MASISAVNGMSYADYWQVTQMLDLPHKMVLVGYDQRIEDRMMCVRIALPDGNHITITDPIDDFPSPKLRAKLLALS